MTTPDAKYTAAARRWKRYYLRGTVKIINTRNQAKMMIFGQVDNVSEGGMGLYSPQALEINETVEIELQFPMSNSSTKFLGTVRNASNGHYGIEFCELALPQREELLRACRALSTLQGR
jgi:PilZ domain-containing protein